MGFSALSLGKGQEKDAEEMINLGKEQGSWVLLQNCHLFTDFFDKLKEMCKELKRDCEYTNETFRLILTSMPHDNFPESILANSLKLT